MQASLIYGEIRRNQRAIKTNDLTIPEVLSSFMNNLSEGANMSKNGTEMTLSTKETAKKNTVLYQLTLINRMSLEELQAEWRKLNAGQSAPPFKRAFLLKKLAWRIQEIHYGGLSQKALDTIRQRAELDPIAKIDAKSQRPTAQNKGILPGTRLVRIWGGQRYEVVALEKGFEFNSHVYRSLSAIAEEITGTHWNGRNFFGVKN